VCDKLVSARLSRRTPSMNVYYSRFIHEWFATRLNELSSDTAAALRALLECDPAIQTLVGLPFFKECSRAHVR
jgi:hypothetical protein